MEYAAAEFPNLPGGVQAVEMTDEKIAGNPNIRGNGLFTPRKGDVYEFSVLKDGKCLICESGDGQNRGRWIPVVKNGKKTYISLGMLGRTDKDNNYVSDFAEQFIKDTDNSVDKARTVLANKKLEVVDMVEKIFTRFGTTVEESRQTPVFKYV